MSKIAPLAVLAVPNVSALAPCTVSVPVKLAELLMVWLLIKPEVIVPLEILILPDWVAPSCTKPLLAIPPRLSEFRA